MLVYFFKTTVAVVPLTLISSSTFLANSVLLLQLLPLTAPSLVVVMVLATTLASFTTSTVCPFFVGCYYFDSSILTVVLTAVQKAVAIWLKNRHKIL